MSCAHCGDEQTHERPLCPTCGALIRRPASPIVVDGRYRIDRTLGVGAMGVVHRATDLRSGRTVALKLIAPERARDSMASPRFAREAASLAAIRHPNVVRVLGFGNDGGASYYAMEYIAGPSLEDIVAWHAKEGKWLPVERAIPILLRIAEGLEAVHRVGLVHRDVKPANIMIERGTERPVLLDFGLARMAARADAKTVGAGTPGYMAPEQVDDEEVESLEISPRTDVYALGCTAYEVFTAAPPFLVRDPEALMHAHVHTPPEPLSVHRPELAAFDAVLDKALAKDPNDRFAGALELARALHDAWQARSS